MAVLEQITNMRNQGFTTGQIIQNLKEQRISPKEINEALSQSEIKSEVNKTQNFPENNYQSNYGNYAQNQLQNQDIPELPNPNMPYQQSMQPPNQAPIYPQFIESSQINTQETIPSIMPDQQLESSNQPTQPYAQEQYPDDSNYQYQEYQYPDYVPPQAIDVETINDLINQIIDEKIQDINKEISSFAKFRKETTYKIQEIDKKLSKIKDNLDDLQLAIIKKIGNYGEDIDNITKELKATQDSFSKIIDPLTDKIRDTEREQPSKKSHKSKKKK